MRMASWTFLTHHARVLLCVAHDGRERTIGEILALLAGPGPTETGAGRAAGVPRSTAAAKGMARRVR